MGVLVYGVFEDPMYLCIFLSIFLPMARIQIDTAIGICRISTIFMAIPDTTPFSGGERRRLTSAYQYE